jgi:hypothetical protein
MPTNITFRTQLVGSVYEFCRNSELPLSNNALHLVELIALLARSLSRNRLGLNGFEGDCGSFFDQPVLEGLRLGPAKAKERLLGRKIRHFSR